MVTQIQRNATISTISSHKSSPSNSDNRNLSCEQSVSTWFCESRNQGQAQHGQWRQHNHCITAIMCSSPSNNSNVNMQHKEQKQFEQHQCKQTATSTNDIPMRDAVDSHCNSSMSNTSDPCGVQLYVKNCQCFPDRCQSTVSLNLSYPMKTSVLHLYLLSLLLMRILFVFQA